MKPLNVTIMGQPYVLACKEGEETKLRETVAYLDQKMKTIRDAGKIKGTDRIAVMAALGITADLLSFKQPTGPFSDMTIAEVEEKLANMHQTLDTALTPQENLF